MMNPKTEANLLWMAERKDTKSLGLWANAATLDGLPTIPCCIGQVNSNLHKPPGVRCSSIFAAKAFLSDKPVSRSFISSSIKWGSNLYQLWRFAVKPHCTCMLCCFSCVWLFATPWTVACQAPLSMGFSWQEYQSRLPCPPPGPSWLRDQI